MEILRYVWEKRRTASQRGLSERMGEMVKPKVTRAAKIAGVA